MNSTRLHLVNVYIAAIIIHDENTARRTINILRKLKMLARWMHCKEARKNRNEIVAMLEQQTDSACIILPYVVDY